MCELLIFNVSSTRIGSFETPIKWTKAALLSTHLAAMSTITDPNSDYVYLCGGKEDSSKCIKIQIMQITDSCGRKSLSIKKTNSFGNSLKILSQYSNIYFNAKPFYAETQNEGGIYGDRICFLSVSDGTQYPKSLSCNLQKSECINLMYTMDNTTMQSIHPQRFGSCVVFDPSSNILFNIGGYFGQIIFDTIICFDMVSQRFLSSEHCNFGVLFEPIYGLGCAIMPDAEHSIVTVGGLNTLSTLTSTPYSKHINVCKNGKCERLRGIKLEKGVMKSRIFAVDACHIAIAGGAEIMSSNFAVINVCTQSLIYSDALPIGLSEFGLIKSDNFFCLYGGIVLDENTNLPKISESAYCTSYYPTSAPTTAPTLKPTLLPTVSIQFTSESTITTNVMDLNDEGLAEETLWILIGSICGILVILSLIAVSLYIVWKRYQRRNDVPEPSVELEKKIKYNLEKNEIIDCLTPNTPIPEGKLQNCVVSNTGTLSSLH